MGEGGWVGIWRERDREGEKGREGRKRERKKERESEAPNEKRNVSIYLASRSRSPAPFHLAISGPVIPRTHGLAFNLNRIHTAPSV